MYKIKRIAKLRTQNTTVEIDTDLPQDEINVSIGGNEEVGVIMFNERICSDSITLLIAQIEELNVPINCVYFSSGGGSITASTAFIDYVSASGKFFEFIVNGEILSAGLDIATQVAKMDNTYVRVLDTAVGMAHLPDFDMSYRDMLNDRSCSAFMKKNVDRLAEKCKSAAKADLFDPFMTPNDYEDYTKGIDVWMDTDILIPYFDRLQIEKNKKIDAAELEEAANCACETKCDDCDCEGGN